MMSTPETTKTTTPAPAPAPAPAQTPPTAGSATPTAPATTKKKRGGGGGRKAHDFVLVTEEKLADGKRRWTEIAPPEGIDLKSKTGRVRKNIKNAVKTALESGKGPLVALYGGKRLTCLFVGEGFLFNAKVEEVKATKVIVSEG